jgi:uncharacterized SAM-binding protein YcdF (DUF218 family)
MDSQFDVIIVLAGNRTHDGDLDQSAIARLEKAIEIHKSSGSKLIFALGGYREDYRKTALLFKKSNADLYKDYLVEKGIFPGDVVFSDKECQDVIGEALEACRWIKRLGVKKILIVTSEEQGERALFVFRQVLGSDYQISTAEVSPGLLIVEEEREYLALVRKYFGELPKGLVEVDLEDWHKNHIDLYEAMEQIRNKFH